MVAPNARDVLKKENELLNELASTATMLANKAKLEAKIFNAWQQSFRRYRERNEELIDANDSNFERGLAEEIKILESLRNSITGNSGVADNWRKDLDDDIALWKKML